MLHIRHRKETILGIVVVILLLAALLTFSTPQLGGAADIDAAGHRNNPDRKIVREPQAQTE